MKPTTAVLHAAFIAVFAVTASHIDSRPADAAVIKQGEVCKRNNDHCITIGGGGDSVPFLVKSHTFNAPTAGTALVSFHGTMQCINDADVDDTSHGVIDLTTQIVIGAETPSFQAPGGQRHAMRLAPPGSFDHSVPVNLASARVLQLTQGKHTFSFKMVRNAMQELTTCHVHNGNFTVVFVP